MYEIIIKIPSKRVGVINKIRKLLTTSYGTASVKNRCTVNEIAKCQCGSMKEVGITFEVKEIEE